MQATWEPVARDGSRLGRLIRRRKPAAAATSCGPPRVALTVLEPRRPPATTRGGEPSRDGPQGRGRGRLGRPDAVAELPAAGLGPIAPGRARPIGVGRARRGPDRAVGPRPAPRLVPAHAAPRPTELDPADGSGLAWSAVGLEGRRIPIGPTA